MADANFVVGARDSEFYGAVGGYDLQLDMTNCLFYRTGIGQSTGDSQHPWETWRQIYRNCTFYGGKLNWTHWESAPYWRVSVRDCTFDGTVPNLSPPLTNGVADWAWLDNGYNAYLTNAATLPDSAGSDQIVADFNWQRSWFGDFYLPPDSPLIDAGDVTADRAGLYEFTTQTNQTEEGVSPVDLGCHYVATDQNGNPLETLTNTAPDYRVDANGDGLPDWWELDNLGGLGHYASELDAYGNTLLYDYTNNVDLSTSIQFTIEVTNNYVKTANPPAQINLESGFPHYIAVSVDDTNFAADAVSNIYTGSNVTINVGSTEGWHDVWIGLRGYTGDANSAVWVWKRLKLDTTPPALVITGPTNGTVDVPVIQIQGYCPEPLDTISCDVSNALGWTTNLDAGVTDEYYDTNLWEFTTSYFECADVPLTNGVNTITLHATDLAGNTATLTTNITLSYASKTNPPVVQLYWPQDGTLISSSPYTWRGHISDPTAAVTAQLVDTNGDTNIFNGIVERNGDFWVENMPLSAGSNWLTLTATDAAGNTTNVSMTVFPSAVAMSIAMPSSDQLWNQGLTVDGTISDPGDYTVWVNGVKANDTGGTGWEATNVDLPAGGTALIQARAIPNGDNGGNGTGGSGGGTGSYDNVGNPASAQAQDAESQVDRPPRLYVAVYSEGDTSGVHIVGDGQPGDWFYNRGDEREDSLAWIDQQGGNAESLKDLTWNDYFYGASSGWSSQHTTQDWPASAWPTLVDGTGTSDNQDVDNVTGETNSSSYSFPDVPPPVIVLEYCQVAGKNSGTWDYSDPEYGIEEHVVDHVSYARHAEAVMKLETGGKGGSQRQNLFDLSASASRCEGMRLELNYPPANNPGEYDVPPDWGNWVKVDSTEITIMGRPLGADGNLWVTLPDNDTRVVTPMVKGVDHYTFNEGKQKYQLRIRANNAILQPDAIAPNANFCVGQKVNFSPDWLPGEPPGIQQKSPIKWTFGGTFVNDHWGYPGGSLNYFMNSALLTIETTYAWWVSGGFQPSATYGAEFGEGLSFANGQYVAVTANGKYSMHRPRLVDWHGPDGPVSVYLYSAGSVWRLGVGDDMGRGIMDYDVFVDSQFSGKAGITQVYDDESIPVGYGSNTLDKAEWYSIPNPNLTTISVPFSGANVIALEDHPYEECDSSESTLTALVIQFRDYARFRPDAGNADDNIFVTLGKVSWNANGHATYSSGTWTKDPNSIVTGPTLDSTSDEFPYWTNPGP